jgi:hypothetical protein
MKKNLVLALFCINLGVAACGKDVGSNLGSSPGSNPESSLGNTVVGPCTATGDIRSFTIHCTKIIERFSVGFITVGNRLQNISTINGVEYNTNIQNNGTSLVGSEGSANRLDIRIIFTDSSTASVTLR